jgi:hypothetical protein
MQQLMLTTTDDLGYFHAAIFAILAIGGHR